MLHVCHMFTAHLLIGPPAYRKRHIDQHGALSFAIVDMLSWLSSMHVLNAASPASYSQLYTLMSCVCRSKCSFGARKPATEGRLITSTTDFTALLLLNTFHSRSCD